MLLFRKDSCRLQLSDNGVLLVGAVFNVGFYPYLPCGSMYTVGLSNWLCQLSVKKIWNGVFTFGIYTQSVNLFVRQSVCPISTSSNQI